MSDPASSREVFRQIKAFLTEHGIDGYIEPYVIYETVFGQRYDPVSDRSASEEEINKAKKILQKRAAGYPLQYIAGKWPFLDFELFVGEGVLIPRADTESAVKACLNYLQGLSRPSIIDLCSGSGCIAIAIKLACPDAEVTAVENSETALEYLARNISAQGADIRMKNADVFGYERELKDDSADLIVCNPPYISKEEYETLERELYYEPEGALTDKKDGLSFYRYITDRYRGKIKPGGKLIFETADGKANVVKEILRDAGFMDIEVSEDDFQNPRVVSAER